MTTTCVSCSGHVAQHGVGRPRSYCDHCRGRDIPLTRARDAGRLICRCDDPQPEHIPLYDAWQCGRCWRIYRPEL